MTILVTGASGFIGSALAPALRANGARVRTAHRVAMTGDAEAIAVGDIGPDTDWRTALDGIHTIIHLAGIAHARASEGELERVNVQGVRRLVDAASEAGVKRFVFVSSIKAAAESSDRVLTESDRPAPGTPYGRAKLAAEEIVLKRSALKPIVVRPPLVFGPGAKANAAALLRLADTPLPLPLAGFDTPRSYIALSTLVAALRRAALQPGPSGIYYIAERAPVGIGQLVAALRDGLGRPARLFAAPVPAPAAFRQRLTVSDDAFRREYGYGDLTARSAHDALADAARAWKASRS